ncbi:MAG: 2-oxo-4-hydroxy-4-carboxy-5-ureidoimidazoline decarboxylase [Alphaproteobacteria bacterium]
MPTDKLEELNSADDERAVALVGPLIERAPEIAAAVARLRPFDSKDDLVQGIRDELRKLNATARVELFNAHPELAPENPLAMTDMSQAEQGRMDLTGDDNAYRARITDLNTRYRAKFAFPFITALVRHSDMESVLTEFEGRLANDHQEELENALEQVIMVSASRARALFGGGAGPEASGTAEVHDHRVRAWGGEIGGAILFAISIIFIIGGLQLGLGSPLRLGTGAFPFLTGLILAGLSVVVCIYEMRGREGLAEKPDWMGFLAIIGALAVFAATADRFGLMPAAFLAVVVASLPDRNLPLAGKAVLGGVVATASWVLFIEMLNLPFKAFAVM